MRLHIQEYTSYHFDVIPGQLHGALDRFAQFFIEPLCKADALEREVQAVNSEFVGRLFLQALPCTGARTLTHTWLQDKTGRWCAVRKCPG